MRTQALAWQVAYRTSYVDMTVHASTCCHSRLVAHGGFPCALAAAQQSVPFGALAVTAFTRKMCALAAAEQSVPVWVLAITAFTR